MTTNKAKIAIWGASGHALVVADIVQLLGEWEIAGYVDDLDPSRWGKTFAGGIVGGGDDWLLKLRSEGVTRMVVAIGDCAARLRTAEHACRHGFQLTTLKHPTATVAQGVTIGAGTVIAAHAVVNPGCLIGQSVIINTSASVDHECVIEDGVHIAPGARLAGRVAVGIGAWIGIGATLKDRVRVGARSVVGAGSVVLKDIPEGVVAYGCPAQFRRQIYDDKPNSNL